MVAVHRRAVEGRLQPGQAAVGGRIADRAEAVGADRAGDEPAGNRGGGPARGSARAALGVPGVVGRAVDGDRAGAAGAELFHVSDPDDHRAGIAQGAVGAGLARCRRLQQFGTAEALGSPGQGPLVLDHDGDAAQGAVRRRQAKHLPRALGEGLDDRVQLRVSLLDSRQGFVEELGGVGVARRRSRPPDPAARGRSASTRLLRRRRLGEVGVALGERRARVELDQLGGSPGRRRDGRRPSPRGRSRRPRSRARRCRKRQIPLRGRGRRPCSAGNPRRPPARPGLAGIVQIAR